ncbi:phospholipase/carboxylesterase family protein [Nemania sp. FL0916]|nr:phospholipase/carboxylesterase family protein [Nemania sp. FL0916]
MVLGCVTLPHDNQQSEIQHTHTVIFLHGHLGSARQLSQKIWDSEDDRGTSLQHIFPSVKWVFPQAEDVYIESIKEEKSQWFDIWDSKHPDQRRELQIPGLKKAIPELVHTIQEEARLVGLEKIILAGVSQGCATAIQTLLNYPQPEEAGQDQRLCALVGFSGWMCFGDCSVQESRDILGLNEIEGPAPDDSVYRNTPVFMAHCADDPTILMPEAERVRDSLTGYGMTVTWHKYQSGGHWINSPKGICDLVKFFEAQGVKNYKPEDEEREPNGISDLVELLEAQDVKNHLPENHEQEPNPSDECCLQQLCMGVRALELQPENEADFETTE